MFDMTHFDPDEVERFRSRPDCDGATIRFAIHMAERCPTHVWPHMLFARFSADAEERYYHLQEAVAAGNAQLEAERNGSAGRRRDRCEAKLFRNALYAFAHQSALMGRGDSAAHSMARLLEVDPTDRMNVVGMAMRMGVIPTGATEVSSAMRM